MRSNNFIADVKGPIKLRNQRKKALCNSTSLKRIIKINEIGISKASTTIVESQNIRYKLRQETQTQYQMLHFWIETLLKRISTKETKIRANTYVCDYWECHERKEWINVTQAETSKRDTWKHKCKSTIRTWRRWKN